MQSGHSPVYLISILVKNIEIGCKILSFGTGLKNRSIDLMVIITDPHFKTWRFNLFAGSE